MSLVLYLLQLIAELMLAFGAELLFLIALGLFALLIAGVIAPLGALGWWAGWSDTTLSSTASRLEIAQLAPVATRAGTAQLAPIAAPAPTDNAGLPPRHFLVYLSGIGDVSGSYLAASELAFIGRLSAALPTTRIIHNVFPYSVTNVGLVEAGDRGFWSWVVSTQHQGGHLARLAWLINLRNLLQVTVSADQRYGPVYNFGLARSILHSLEDAGYLVGSATPVTLYGYSGGGQIVLASSSFLQPALGAPLQIISMGGVMADCAGLETASEIVHLQGTLDGVQRLGDFVFPRRWPIIRGSRWNRALACGKLRRIDMGPMTHNGARCYIDAEAYLPDGRSHLDATTAQVVELVQDYLTRVTPSARGAVRVQSEPGNA